MMWLLGIAVAAAIAFAAVRGYDTAEQKKRAAAAYSEALEHLKSNPTNSDFRQAALRCGRAYYTAMNERPLTATEEMAIMNDLNAASAG